jgi:hypothetical protein
MTRVDAAAYLAGQFSQLLTEAGIGDDDESGELREPIDDAMLAMGVAFSDLTDDTYELSNPFGFRAVLRLKALERIYDAVANRVDISLDGPTMSKARSQFLKHLKDRIDAARIAATPYMTAEVETFWSTGHITLGSLEPEEVEA